ncbi:ABC transporter ATP-binding protein [Paenibacillus sp. NPDC058071]|uniref:ABC transporter ATP-binding protein n=1 Tax=Paenibacillus sp. NPDC058071 TaxID=3346326 RepID=UPI0036D9779D
MHSLRWLFKEIRSSRLILLLASFTLSLEMVASLATIALQQVMIDDVFKQNDVGRFWTVLLWIAMAYISHAALFTISPAVKLKAYSRIRKILASRLMQAMYRLPISKLQNQRTAHYVYHFTNDLNQTVDIAAEDLPRMVQQIVAIVIIGWIVLEASPALLILIVLLGIVYVWRGRRFGAERYQAAGKVNQSRSEMLVHMDEGVAATREVVAFHRQDWENRKFQKLYDVYFRNVMQEGKLINKQMMKSEPFTWLAMLAVFVFGGWLTLEGSLSLGYFIVIFQFASRLMESINILYSSFLGMVSKLSSTERLRNAIHAEKVQDGISRLSGPVQSLCFDQVTFSYEENKEAVLKSVDLEIPIGKKIAIVGTSGSGKSTMASLLMRFFEPVSGVIRVNEMNLDDIAREDWTSRIAIVSQEPYFLAGTIKNNLSFGQSGVTEEEMAEACRTAYIHDFIATLPKGYDTVIGERGVTLSGGQRQRLALARALLSKREILLLDEATSALDLETERIVQENLDNRSPKFTIVVIAHRLSTVRNADIIYVVEDGSIVECGTHEQLMSGDALYRYLVTKQMVEEAS